MKYCLIVDDSKVVRKFARRIIEELSFEVGEAENGNQGLEECKKRKPDVIILDWNMPEMDGMQFLQKLRSMKEYDVVQVIFCTTENDVRKIQSALISGANEFIMKPFDNEIIKTKFYQLGIIDL
ncbi:MAG: PleD family two-component system response regulator [Alphaproteobacteria bacterium]